MMTDIPEPLQACIDHFWNNNSELRHNLLKDIYVTGRVSLQTTEQACKAVDIWLSTSALPNGTRE